MNRYLAVEVPYEAAIITTTTMAYSRQKYSKRKSRQTLLNTIFYCHLLCFLESKTKKCLFFFLRSVDCKMHLRTSCSNIVTHGTYVSHKLCALSMWLNCKQEMKCVLFYCRKKKANTQQKQRNISNI